jgi:sugar lactone lactonase YvrE
MPVVQATAHVFSPHRDQLGEAPHWDPLTKQLIHVDITAGVVHGLEPETGKTWQRGFEGEVSAAIPCTSGGLLLANGHQLRRADGDSQTVATVEEPDHTRFNDCRCDARGRLWAGTMSRDRIAGSGALYRLVAGGKIERVVDGTTISNGLGWSPGSERMYFIDSLTYRIDVFDYELASGAISNRRAFAEIDPSDGLPDGLTVDSEGCLWVCLFGGGAVRRYEPDGSLDAHIPLPVTNPTCPAFGGPDLQTLYVTSARHRLSPRQLANEPLAGATLALRPGATGRAGNSFAA